MHKRKRAQTRTNFVLAFKITVLQRAVQYVNRTCSHLWETVEVTFRRIFSTVLKSPFTILSDKRVTNSKQTGTNQPECRQICLLLCKFSLR